MFRVFSKLLDVKIFKMFLVSSSHMPKESTVTRNSEAKITEVGASGVHPRSSLGPSLGLLSSIRVFPTLDSPRWCRCTFNIGATWN